MKLNLKKKIKEKFTYLYCDLRNDHTFDLVKLSEINPKKYPFLLESSSRGNKLNRNSILFFSPKTVLVKEKNHQYHR